MMHYVIVSNGVFMMHCVIATVVLGEYTKFHQR